jgi:hypothetical protein
MDALEVASRALKAAAGDEAEAVVQSERSGLARFAGSVQHQPTLSEDTVVTLRIVRDGRVGVAVSNRIGDDGLRLVAGGSGQCARGDLERVTHARTPCSRCTAGNPRCSARGNLSVPPSPPPRAGLSRLMPALRPARCGSARARHRAKRARLGRAAPCRSS